MNTALLYPMSAMILYILVVGLMNFAARFKAVKARAVKLSYFRSYHAEAPEHLVVLGRHFDNQFQVPLLFLITCSLLIQNQELSPLVPALAWGFVATRVLHGFFHLGSNNVTFRAFAYFLGWFIIIPLWIIILLQA